MADLQLRCTQAKEQLQRNLRRKLVNWAPPMQPLIHGKTHQSPVPYIDPKISTVKKSKDVEERTKVSSIQELTEQCKGGERVVICGGAGSGKTTALRNIVLSWLEGCLTLRQKYDYVFYIPLSLVESPQIVDIICHDCELLPEELRDSLSRILAMTGKQILFLLDGFEELAACSEEMSNLINGDSEAQTTVFMTCRPGSRLASREPTPVIRVDFQKFSEEDVKEYLAALSEGDDDALAEVIEKKFGAQFLEKPINLALVHYMYLNAGTGDLHRVSQTELFDRLLVQHLLSYMDKTYPRLKVSFENVLDFCSVRDERVSGAKVFLREISRMCYEELQKETLQLSIVNSDFTVKELLSFGLFFPGVKDNTVELPHPLFQEFLAAVFLVLDVEAREKLFGHIRKKRQYSSLSDALGPMRLDNVLTFVVGLLPVAGRELCSLFVIKQQQTHASHFHQSVYSFELELLRECSTHRGVYGGSDMAKALLDAPVIRVDGQHNYVDNRGAEMLLDIFSSEQSHQFLARAYGCVLKSNSVGDVTMRRSDTETTFICDSYVVGCLQKFRCSELEMGSEMMVRSADISVDLLPILTTGVSEKLLIENCKLLCTQAGEQKGRRDIDRDGTSDPEPKVSLKLYDVKCLTQLRDCDVTLPRVGRLDLADCEGVDIAGFLAFPQLSWLRITRGNKLAYSADFRPHHALRDLTLYDYDEVELQELARLCPQLTDLWIGNCQVLCAEVSRQWPSMRRLNLDRCGEVRLRRWIQLCPYLTLLRIGVFGGGAVCVDDIDSSWHSLQKLGLWNSHLLQRGRRLTKEEAGPTLKAICPSAAIHVIGYQETPRGPI